MQTPLQNSVTRSTSAGQAPWRTAPAQQRARRAAAVSLKASLRALIFDCDGSLLQADAAGSAEARPGVLALMDEAAAAGLSLGVCSVASRDVVAPVLRHLLGEQRFDTLGCLLTGDDVAQAKPDPSIYSAAARQLGVAPDECVVVEETAEGLQAALGAGMRCIITYSPESQEEMFPGAERIVASVASAGITVQELQQRRIVQDDRIEMTVTDTGVYFHIPGK